MASLIDFFLILPCVAALIYFQQRIIKYSKDENEKLYCKILLGLFIFVIFSFLINVDYKFPAGFIIWLGFSVMIAFFALYNFINIRILHRTQEMEEIDKIFQELRGHTHEYLRKFFHFFVFGGVLLFLFIYNSILIVLLDTYPNFGEYYDIHPWWPGFDYKVYPIYILPTQVDGSLWIFFMLALPFAIIVEFFRLSPKMGIPFYRLFVKSLRPKEQYNAAHYYFFVFGVFISTSFLPVACTFGILCVLCFGDTLASIIGKKIGKHKLPVVFQSDKSWEGTIGGSLITFFTSMWFVGWELAIILALIFGVFDILTPNFLKISDNFLYPLLSIAVLYVIVVLLGFEIHAPIADLFRIWDEFYWNYLPDWQKAFYNF